MRSRNRILAAVAALAATAACHPSPAAVRLAPDTAVTRPLDTLRRDIDAALGQPLLAHGSWGVLVKSLKTDETLYALNAGKLMLPASNMKIVTLAAAAERLGWDYRYETRVSTPGLINGVIDGDVRVVGSGDPSLGTVDGIADGVFTRFAEQLKTAGIRAIAGRIVAIGESPGEQLGFGWSWDDLQDDYAAGVSALQFNENMVQATVGPGPAVDDYAAISVSPAHSGLAVRATASTVAAGTPAAVHVRRLPASSTLEISGTIALGTAPRVLSVSVDNPTQFFLESMRAALIANGIDVRGPAVDIRDEQPPPAPLAGPMWTLYTSAPLSTLAMRLMKASQNQYAETFLRTMTGWSSLIAADTGSQVSMRTLETWGVRPSDVIQRDGSGLSRYDFVTPEALVMILTHVDRDPRLKGPFEASLPIAGGDGTLANRMKGTPAEGNARAKTGSMTAVRGLSGYVTSADGEPLVFSILANNFDTPAAAVTQTTDAIVVQLARFRR